MTDNQQPGEHNAPPPLATSLPLGAPQPVPAKGGGRRIAVGVLAVIVVCAGLCGIGQLVTTLVNKDEWKDLGQPVTRPAVVPTPTPTWKQPNPFLPNAKADPQIRYQLETWVLTSAGVQKPVSSTCDSTGFTGQSAATFDCTVTFEGRDVVYTVTATPKGNYVFSWTAKAARTVVTRDGILNLFADQYTQEHGWSNLRCDALPDVALAPVDRALSQVCYAKQENKKTAKILIKPSDKGRPNLETQFQE